MGAALLLAASTAVLGAKRWTAVGTFGPALGPALGGVLTQAFDWARELHHAGAGRGARARRRLSPAGGLDRGRGLAALACPHAPANACLGLLFGALSGALPLVLLVISVWSFTPIAAQRSSASSRGGAGRAAARTAAPAVDRGLRRVRAARDRASSGWRCCPRRAWASRSGHSRSAGPGSGLAIPVLSDDALLRGAALTRSGTLTVGARHVGLVLSLALIAAAARLEGSGGRRPGDARGTAVLLDAPVGLDKKVPVALDLRKAFDRAQAGETPNLRQPFDAHGAAARPGSRRRPRPPDGSDRDDDHARAPVRLLPLRRIRCARSAAGSRLPPQGRAT